MNTTKTLYTVKDKEPFYVSMLLFFAALALRMPGLGREMIMDEPKAVLYVTLPLKKLMDLLIVDSQPPLYYYILKFWSRISADPFFLRFFTVLLGAFICVLLFKIAKRVFGEQVAYYTFIFAALSPQLIFQSQYLRPYCLGTFFSVLLIYLFIKFMDDDRMPVLYFGCLGIITALCLYSFYMSIFIMAALNVFSFYIFWKRKAKLFFWIGSQIVAVLLFSFWLPTFLLQKYLIEKGITCHLLEINNAGIGCYMGKVHVGDLIRIALAYFHFDDILVNGTRYSAYIKPGFLFMAAMLALAIPVLFCILRAVKMMFGAERLRGGSILLLLLIFLPAFSFAVFSIGGDLGLWGYAVVNVRYFSQSSIYALILLAVFLAGIGRKSLRTVIFSIVVAFFLLLDLNIYQHPSDIYKPAVKYLSDEDRHCNVVVLGPPNALGFYNPLSDKRFSDYRVYEFDGSDKAVKEIKRNISTVDGLYFYYFKSAENMVIFPDLDSKFEKLAGGLGFVKKDEKKVSDILIISYFKKN